MNDAIEIMKNYPVLYKYMRNRFAKVYWKMSELNAEFNNPPESVPVIRISYWAKNDISKVLIWEVSGSTPSRLSYFVLNGIKDEPVDGFLEIVLENNKN